MFFFLFCCLGGGPSPAQTAKKMTPEKPKQQKTTTRPRPFRECSFFAVWTGGVFLFLLFGRGGVFFFLLFGWGACSFVCCLGRGRVLFLLFGPGMCFVVCCLGGDGSSLTYRSAWLVKRPNNKKGQKAKKKKRVPLPGAREASMQSRKYLTSQSHKQAGGFKLQALAEIACNRVLGKVFLS